MDMVDWIDNGGSVGCESPGAFPTYDLEAEDAGEAWPRPQPFMPCGVKDDGYICTLSEKHSGEHEAHGSDPLHRWHRPDPINHPPHYTFGKIEVIDVIEDWGLSFHLAQVVKYVARSKHKGKELEDLRKAQFYLNRLITSLEK